MTQATVRAISNGFTVNWQGSQAIGVPASLYAAEIPEAVYWLGRIFDPVGDPGGAQQSRLNTPAQLAANPSTVQGIEAVVTDIASGGFIVRQNPDLMGAGITKPKETYSSTMDGVSDLLTQIFAPPQQE